MTDIADRTNKLRERLKRKREEIQEYLDHHFYNTARRILKKAEELDAHSAFQLNPTNLPEYLSSVNVPMFWSLIERKLSSYKYSSPQEFIADMRLVVDNCYAYNGVSSKFSTLARTIEIDMEDAFVKELGEAPPSVAEMKALSKQLPPQASNEIIRVFNLYEKKETKTTNAKAFISLATCCCATKRRILQLMRVAVDKNEAKGAPKPSARKVPVKRPHNAPAASLAKSTPASSAAPLASSTGRAGFSNVVQAADDVNFHDERDAPPANPPATALERVPQNVRTDGFAMRDISPARLEESASDGDNTTTSCSSSSSYAPVSGAFDDDATSAEPPGEPVATDTVQKPNADLAATGIDQDTPAIASKNNAIPTEKEESLEFNENT